MLRPLIPLIQVANRLSPAAMRTRCCALHALCPLACRVLALGCEEVVDACERGADHCPSCTRDNLILSSTTGRFACVNAVQVSYLNLRCRHRAAHPRRFGLCKLGASAGFDPIPDECANLVTAAVFAPYAAGGMPRVADLPREEEQPRSAACLFDPRPGVRTEVENLRNGPIGEVPDLTRITHNWLGEQTRKCFRTELGKNQEDDHHVARLTEAIHSRLTDNGVVHMDQLHDLAIHGDLAGVIECSAVTDNISRYFYTKIALKRRDTPIQSFWISLAGNFESMQNMCVNYGLAAALLTFGNFGAVDRDAWDAFYHIVLSDPDCQGEAKEHCGDEQIDPNQLGFVSAGDHDPGLRCLTAMDTVLEDRAADLEAIGMGCCKKALECTKVGVWRVELYYSLGNGAGSAFLLLVVLFSSWLYIALHATKVNHARWAEQEFLIARLRQEFCILQVLFAMGLILALFGIYSVMVVKVTTSFLSYLSRLLSTSPRLLPSTSPSKFCSRYLPSTMESTRFGRANGAPPLRPPRRSQRSQTQLQSRQQRRNAGNCGAQSHALLLSTHGSARFSRRRAAHAGAPPVRQTRCV